MLLIVFRERRFHYRTDKGTDGLGIMHSAHNVHFIIHIEYRIAVGDDNLTVMDEP